MSFPFHPEGTEDKTQLRQTELVRDMKNLNLTSRSALPKKYGPKACALWRSTCPSIVIVGPGRNSSSFENSFTFLCPFGLPPHPCSVCPTSALPQSASGPSWSDEGSVTAGTFQRSRLVLHLSPSCLTPSLHLSPGCIFPWCGQWSWVATCHSPEIRPPGSPAQFHTN